MVGVQADYCIVVNKFWRMPLRYYNLGYCRYVSLVTALRVTEDVNAKQVPGEA